MPQALRLVAYGDTQEGNLIAQLEFDDPDLLLKLETRCEYDDLPFGLIVMDRSGEVTAYNRWESERAGLSVDKVVGRNFFTSVGPCTDNRLIAGRFREEPDLDEFLDFTFSLRMMLSPVRLRLLAKRASTLQYLAVVQRDLTNEQESVS